jgi:hypothetical protein
MKAWNVVEKTLNQHSLSLIALCEGTSELIPVASVEAPAEAHVEAPAETYVEASVEPLENFEPIPAIDFGE